MEQTNIEVNQKTIDTIYKKSYFNLFPTVHVKYEFSDKQGLQLSYSRRINRPNYHTLNPFVNIADPLNISYGNPYLNPEFYSSYELAYSMDFDKFSFLPSVFYRQTNNMITRFTTLRNDGVSETTYMNLDKGSFMGLEFIYSQQIIKGWKVNTNLSLFKSYIEGQGISASNSANNKISWTAKINSTASVTKGFSIQLNFFYNSPVTSAISSEAGRFSGGGSGQSIMKENYALSLGFRKDLFKAKWSLTVRVNDIFNTLSFNIDTYGDNFTATTLRKRESRILFVGLSYKISGGIKPKNKGKKHSEDENEDDYDF
jgi:outer membrane receptor protein involved in Fe transport